MKGILLRPFNHEQICFQITVVTFATLIDREDTANDLVDSTLPDLYHNPAVINLRHIIHEFSLYSSFNFLNTDLTRPR